MQNNEITVMELINLGGPVIIILIILSVIMMSVGIFKVLQFTKIGIWRPQKSDQHIRIYFANLQNEMTINHKGSSNPILQILQYCHDLKNKDKQIATEEISYFASEKIEQMKSGLRLLEFIGMISPLLGLFGTVLGMITSFQQMQLSGVGADSSVLSGGIWVALLTTAAGLAVAMPAVALHNFLDSVVTKTIIRMERLAGRILSLSDQSERNINIKEGGNIIPLNT